MGIYLNPGNEQFKMVTRSEIYVDKTMLLSLTNNRICTMDKYMAVSRPRRFGKTITMDMLCAYYSRGCDSHALFAPYQIAAEKSFEKHLNQYNVIQVNMRDFVSRTSSMQETLETLAKELMFEILDEFSDVRYFNSKDLLRSLLDVYRSTKIPFVFLIDEWDTVFRIKEISANEQILYLDFLRMILKDKAYVALAYITGILPIKKYGEHSALNMFTEYSMTNQRELAEATGFTEEEVRELCKKYSMPYDETKRWYDGYQLKEISVYNPRSVVMSMTGHDFDSYWTKTETYTALKDYIEMNFDGLQDTVINLMSGNKTVVDTHSFVNDMVTFAAKDDVLTLLIHLGYLTYDFYTSEVWIPNQEVMGEFATSIKVLGWSAIADALRDSFHLLNATLVKNSTVVADMLEKIHQSETSIMAYHDENALAAVITIAYYAARKDYTLARELPSGKGYADISFLPKKGSPLPALIIELKIDKSVDTAIAQIKNKQYVEGLKDYHGKVLLVGISYDRKNKRHSCLIEEALCP